jgi:hypothetical protein
VDYFLFNQQSGYCSHFATAMAVMCRYSGLPARVAVGYLPGYIDPLTGAHIVRAGDAHAWVEVHFNRTGWVAFDPTPRPDSAMGFASGHNMVYFGIEDFTGGSLAGLVSPLFTGFSPGSVSPSVWLITGTALGAIVAAVLVIAVRRRRKNKKREVMIYSALDGEARKTVLRLYRKMTGILAGKGIPARAEYQAPYEYAVLVRPLIGGSGKVVEELTRLANRAAYDPAPFEMPDTSEIKKSLSALRQALSKQVVSG